MAEEQTKMSNMESKQGTRSHPKLPDFLQQGTIGNMYPGESAAVRCVSIRVTEDGKVWLDPQLEIYDDLSPEHPLLVWRTEEGYGVDLEIAVKEAPYRWAVHEDLATISEAFHVEENEWIVPHYLLPRMPELDS